MLNAIWGGGGGVERVLLGASISKYCTIKQGSPSVLLLAHLSGGCRSMGGNMNTAGDVPPVQLCRMC